MKPNLFRTLLSSLLILLSISSVAQTEITSKVSDFLTFMPIENANIYIKNTTIGTISNADGRFLLQVPEEHVRDTLIISSIGYKSFKMAIPDFDESMEVYLEEDVAALDEVVVVAATRPTTGNEIVLRALEKLEANLPEEPYLQKGFLRHKERNQKEYKWLIESAITLYDSSYASGSEDNLKINVDEIRKSYDLRDVDSLFTYYSFLRYNVRDFNMKSQKLRRDTIETASLIEAIKWNDRRVNGLQNLFKGRLNLVRNSNSKQALFGKDILEKHQFELDTILVDDGKKIYKIRIKEGPEYVGLNTRNIYNEGFNARGWIYIYWDNFAIKKIEYELVAASEIQRRRSKSLFDTDINHKYSITFTEYDGRMYPKYIYYETPKLVNVGNRSSDRTEDKEELQKQREEQFYYTVQEILFTDIVQEPGEVSEALRGEWSDDIFVKRPYNADFWKRYNVLLESEEEEKLIRDLSKRASLFEK